MVLFLLTEIVFLLLFDNLANGNISTSGKTTWTVSGKMADVEAFRENTVDGLATCSRECGFDEQCKSANAIMKSDGLFICQLLDSTVKEDRLTNIANSTYLLIEEPVRSCEDLQDRYGETSGVFHIELLNESALQVYCDQATGDGGWLVIQRRMDGSVEFYRDWHSFKTGFGNIDGEFWFGLDQIHVLVKEGMTSLRFDFWDASDHLYAIYGGLTIADESDNYRINWESFEGNAEDPMAVSRFRQFSTYDRDNDLDENNNCAVSFPSAWWHALCFNISPNGRYNSTDYAAGLFWSTSHGYFYSFPNVEMKIKPEN